MLVRINREEILRFLLTTDVSVKELSEKSGVARYALSEILNGKKERVTIKTVKKLSSAMNVDPIKIIMEEKNENVERQ